MDSHHRRTPEDPSRSPESSHRRRTYNCSSLRSAEHATLLPKYSWWCLVVQEPYAAGLVSSSCWFLLLSERFDVEWEFYFREQVLQLPLAPVRNQVEICFSGVCT